MQVTEVGAKAAQPKVKPIEWNGGWKNTVLVAFMVTHVAMGVFCFLAGEWALSLLMFGTAYYESIMRKELKDHANLRKETYRYKQENQRFGLSNVELRITRERLEKDLNVLHKRLSDFQSKLNRMEKENNKFASSNRVLAGENATFQESNIVLQTNNAQLHSEIQNLNEHVRRADQELNQVLSKFEGVSDEMSGNLGILGKQIKDLDKLKKHASRKQLLFLDQAKRVNRTLQETGRTQQAYIESANQELIRTREHLEELRAEIAEQRRLLDDVTRRLEAATRGVEQSSGWVSRFFNRVNPFAGGGAPASPIKQAAPIPSQNDVAVTA